MIGVNVAVISCGGQRYKQSGPGDQPMVRRNKKPSAAAIWENSIGQPVSVIMGCDHPQFKDLDFGSVIPSKASFVELGTFIPIDSWPEMVHPEGVHKPYPVWKTKHHTARTDVPPYYTISGNNNLMSDTTIATTHSRTLSQDATIPQGPQQHCQEIKCTGCGKMSPKILANAPWVCLRHGCKKFWIKDGKLLAQVGDDGEPLRYSGAFLKETKPFFCKKKEPQGAITQMFQPLRASIDGAGKKFWGTEKELRGGFTCPRCYCCNSQRYWDRLECRNCGFKKDATPLPYPMKKIEDETKNLQKRPASKAIDGVTVKMEESRVDQVIEDADNGSKLYIYMMKDRNGKLMGTLVVERPTEDLKKAPCGADELFEKLQAEGAEMKFQRNPARCKESRNEVLTRHYQSNWGVPYDFGVKAIPNIPFEEALDVVLMSLAYLTDAGKRALKRSQILARERDYDLVKESTLMKTYEPYNELLALAYRETDAISFHDDGEDQVKGVISTASLGSPATMEIRMMKKKPKKTDKGSAGQAQDASAGQVDDDPEGPAWQVEDDSADQDESAGQEQKDSAGQEDDGLVILKHRVLSKGVRRYAVTSRAIDLTYYENNEQKAKDLNLTVEEMKANGKLPDRARNFSYGESTLGV